MVNLTFEAEAASPGSPASGPNLAGSGKKRLKFTGFSGLKVARLSGGGPKCVHLAGAPVNTQSIFYIMDICGAARKQQLPLDSAVSG